MSLTLCVAPCVAQLRSVEIRVSGLDCESCARSVEPRLKKLRGVESARFDGERGIANITLVSENRVTLNDIRDTLKNLGHKPGDASIVVLGDIRDGRLSLPHQPDAFTLENHPGAAGRIKIEGVVPASTTTLQVRAVTKPD